MNVLKAVLDVHEAVLSLHKDMVNLQFQVAIIKSRLRILGLLQRVDFDAAEAKGCAAAQNQEVPS